jgi:hypothetical protein
MTRKKQAYLALFQLTCVFSPVHVKMESVTTTFFTVSCFQMVALTSIKNTCFCMMDAPESSSILFNQARTNKEDNEIYKSVILLNWPQMFFSAFY